MEYIWSAFWHKEYMSTFAVFRILQLSFYSDQFKLCHLFGNNLDSFALVFFSPSPFVIHIFSSMRICNYTNNYGNIMYWNIFSSGYKDTVITYYYSTIAPFYQLWSRARVEYDPVMHCCVPVSSVYNRANTDGKQSNKLPDRTDQTLVCLCPSGLTFYISDNFW